MIGLVLCGGRGTRLGSLVKDKPKCMVCVAGKPVLERIADHMNKHGIWRIVVNLHAFPEVVMKHFGQRFLYLYEPVPMGEFATLNLVKGWFPDEKILSMNGDTLTDFWPGDLDFKTPYDPVVRFVSKKTKRHIGTSIYGGGLEYKKEVDCVYYDIGTPKKLKIARDYYVGN